MKTIFTLFICIFCMALNSQNLKTLDTIYANNSKTVSLFFPKPIRQGIVGKSNFVFSFNKETQQYFGLLQATSGVESNLLTITNDGQIYSFILKYAESLPKLNYFIIEQESIGNEKPSSIVLKRKKKDFVVKDTILPDQSDIYKEICAELMMKSKRKVKRSKRKNQMKLSIKDVTYKDNIVYFLLEIRNNSAIDYDINYLRFFITNKVSTRNTSSQILLKEPIFSYLFPNKIMKQSNSEFVIVFSKFTLNNKRLIVELNEMFGERNIRLKIPML